MEAEDKEVKSLDDIIQGDLKKARDLFKNSVQLMLLNSEFKIENTVRNCAIKEAIKTIKVENEVLSASNGNLQQPMLSVD